MAKRNLTEKERRVLYRRVFTSPEGETVLEDLRTQFYKRSGLTPDNDPNGALACAAQRAMFLYIEGQVEEVDGNLVDSISDTGPGNPD